MHNYNTQYNSKSKYPVPNTQYKYKYTYYDFKSLAKTHVFTGKSKNLPTTKTNKMPLY